jgi:hypothetical protein
MNDETFTVTLLTTLDMSNLLPFFVNLRVESNTQWNFLKFVCEVIESDALVQGDYLIVDNSFVHSGSGAFPDLLNVLETAGIRYEFITFFSNLCYFIYIKCPGLFSSPSTPLSLTYVRKYSLW